MTTPEIPPIDSSDAGATAVLRRVKRNSVVAYLFFAIFVVISAGFRGFVGLTCSAAVTIISFLWLEEIVDSILQPSPQLHSRRLVVRTVARFVLLGAALSVTILVARFNALSVLLGFSIVVVGIISEALYSTYRSLAG